MRVHKSVVVNCGNGTADQIAVAVKDANLPKNAHVTKVEYDTVEFYYDDRSSEQINVELTFEWNDEEDFGD